jgi:hypothetical protein
MSDEEGRWEDEEEDETADAEDARGRTARFRRASPTDASTRMRR